MSLAVGGDNLTLVVQNYNGVVIAVIIGVLHRLVHAENDPMAVLLG